MKYALVTGGSRGIGRAISVKLGTMGYNVIINYVSNKSEAEKTLAEVRETGGDGELLRFDVTDADRTREALGGWQARHQGEYVEVIVNNAGICRDNLMLWMEPSEWGSVIETSLNGFFNVTQPLLKRMLRKNYGRIINIASVSGLQASPGQANYSAAKAGLIAATKTLAAEVASKGVTVNAIAPGYIETDMTSSLDRDGILSGIPAGRFGGAVEVAAVAGFLASGEASYITGVVIPVDGGISA